MKAIKKVEKIAEALIRTDTRGPDYRIAKSEYELIKDNKDSLASLIGESRAEMSWEEFRQAVVKYQEPLGFTWTIARGPFGPIELTKFDFVEDVGEELAQELHKKGATQGSFNTLLEEKLPLTNKYLASFNNEYSYSRARAAFSSVLVNNVRFKFNRNGLQFEAGLEKYSFPSPAGARAEITLGEKLKNHIKQTLQLNFVIHQQEARLYGKYQNVDFEAIRIRRGYASDEALLYNFELKPTNSIEYISDAISQAINYKEFSNYTYIVIPLFDTQNFYDPERFNSFLRMAGDNELGVLSIDINPETHVILGVNEILAAPRRDLQNAERLIALLQESSQEVCPLCRRIVSSDDNRDSCGWTVPKRTSSEEVEMLCMKQVMENRMI